MRLHILVEGLSEKAFLEKWLPRFLPPAHTFKIIPHRGKGRLPRDPSRKPDPKRQGLLDQLPAKLRAYGRELNSDTDRVLVLVDLDNDDCRMLKTDLLNLLSFCGATPPVALFRIAIEETEAFYLGDKSGIRRAYPKCNIQRMGEYTPDSICGAWELFRDVIEEKGEDKVEWGRRMGKHLTTQWKGADANDSPSFRQFCRGLLKLAGEEAGD